MIDIKTEIAGVVAEILVAPGDRVEIGDELLLIESMKMLVPVGAVAPGIVQSILVKPGQPVDVGALAVILTPIE